MDISICLSTVRYNLWGDFLKSLKDNKIFIEVIFVGEVHPSKEEIKDFLNIVSNLPKNISVRYISTKVKPSQCYEIAFRESCGELIHWSSDEAIYNYSVPNAIDKMYEFYKSFKTNKLITAFTVKENNGETFSITSNGHYVGNNTTPRMACFGVISSKFMKELGGYDKRFITGQSENDLCLRCLENGGKIEFNKETIIAVYHNKINHKDSKFRKWYPPSRKFLEDCWFLEPNKISPKRLIPFEPFDNKDILTVSQFPKGDW